MSRDIAYRLAGRKGIYYASQKEIDDMASRHSIRVIGKVTEEAKKAQAQPKEAQPRTIAEIVSKQGRSRKKVEVTRSEGSEEETPAAGE